MTKQLQSSILVDEPTADWVRDNVSVDILRVRRVAKVVPFGMNTPLVVSELLPPEGEESILTNEHLEIYESATGSFFGRKLVRSFRSLA